MTSGDPGYFNRWTLEIENHSLVPTVLKVGEKVGEKVGQMVFMRTGDVSGAPAPRALKGLEPYTVKGQYQKTSDLETLIQEWSPLCMIPSKAVTYLRTQGAPASRVPGASLCEGGTVSRNTTLCGGEPLRARGYQSLPAASETQPVDEGPPIPQM